MGLLAPGPDLGGEERLVARLHLRQQVADHAFRAAVHGRGIDQRRAGIEQQAQHFLALGAGGRVLADIEALPGAEAHDRQLFGRLGDGPGANFLQGRHGASRGSEDGVEA
jgi:hypothetical protein